MENELFEIIAEVKDVKSLRSFKNSLAAYYLEDGRIGGYVDYTGSKVMMPVYDSSADFYLSPDGEFNDGVKIGLNANEQWVYMDVNTNEIMPYPLDGYGDYNFGYFSTIKSNITDEGIIFETIFTNIADDAVFTFKNAYIPTFDNNGYSIMNLNDDSGRPCGCYIIRLKRVIIPTVQLNGIKIAFDQIPNIENGRTLVPLRGIFEALGAEVEWNGATQTVTATKGDTVITLP